MGGFFSSGFGRVLAGVSTGGLSEVVRNPGGFMGPIGALAGFGIGGPTGAGVGMQIGNSIGGMFSAQNAAAQSEKAATAQNIYNAAQADKQMQFQERMSSTAHQREVADLKAAGLNPILSASGGSGASTPSGAISQAADMTGTYANSALKQRELNQGLVEILSRVALNASQTSLNQSTTELTAQKAKTETFFNHGIDQFLGQSVTPAVSDSLLSMPGGKYLGETASALQQLKNQQATEEQTRAYKELLLQQNLTEQSKRKLISEDTKIRAEELKSLVNQGKISETQFGLAMAYVDRFLRTVGPVLPWFKPSSGGITINR